MSSFKRPAGKGGGDGDFELPSDEPQPAVLVGIIDLGTQMSQFGKQHQIAFVWELTGEEKKTDGSPFILVHRFTLSMNEKSNLYKFVQGWRKDVKDGEDYDPAELLGRKAILNIELKTGQGEKGDRTYLNILGASKPRKGETVADPVNDPLLWEIEGAKTLPEYDWLPLLYGKPIQEVIRESDEWRARGAAAAKRAKPGNGKTLEQEADEAFSKNGKSAPADFPDEPDEEEAPVRRGKPALGAGRDQTPF